MYRIEIIDTLEDKGLKKAWEEIYSKGGYFVQNSYEWISTWWEYFKKSSRLLVVVVKKEKEIVGIGPFMIQGHFFFKELKFIGSGFTDFHEILAKPEDRDAILFSILDFISNYKKYDLLNLEQIPDNSPLYDILNEAGQFKKREMVKCPIVNFHGLSWEEYFKRLSRNFRREWTKKSNRIKKKGELEFIRLKNTKEKKDYFQKIFDLHIRCGEHKGFLSRFIRESVREFFRKLILKIPNVVVYVLLIDGELVAYRIGFDQRGIFYTWNTAYDPRFHSYSVGKIILGLIIQDLIIRKYKKINMMRGNYSYKRRWMTDKEILTNYQFLYNINSHKGYLGMRYYLEWKWWGKRILRNILSNSLVQKARIKVRY